MRFLFIVNPKGGGGTALASWRKFKRLWPDPIDPERVKFTERPRHATELAASARGYEAVVAVGGDGTVGEVVNGLMELGGEAPPLGIIPAGSGNDYAVAQGIRNVEDAVEVLQTGKTRNCDLIQLSYSSGGTLVHKYAAVYVSVGFSAIKWAKPWMKRWFGARIAYNLAIVAEILSFRPPELEAIWEGGEYIGKVVALAAARIDYIGGGSLRIAPEARPDDGKMWLVIMPYRSKFHLITSILPNARSGKFLRDPDVISIQPEVVEITGDERIPVAIDGDYEGSIPARLRLVPKALKVIAK